MDFEKAIATLNRLARDGFLMTIPDAAKRTGSDCDILDAAIADGNLSTYNILGIEYVIPVQIKQWRWKMRENN